MTGLPIAIIRPMHVDYHLLLKVNVKVQVYMLTVAPIRLVCWLGKMVHRHMYSDGKNRKRGHVTSHSSYGLLRRNFLIGGFFKHGCFLWRAISHKIIIFVVTYVY